MGLLKKALPRVSGCEKMPIPNNTKKVYAFEREYQYQNCAKLWDKA